MYIPESTVEVLKDVIEIMEARWGHGEAPFDASMLHVISSLNTIKESIIEKVRVCVLCGINDVESKHVRIMLSHPAGHVPICRECWQEQEDIEAEREQQEEEYIQEQ